MIVTLLRSKEFGFEGEEGCTRGERTRSRARREEGQEEGEEEGQEQCILSAFLVLL